MKRLTVIVCCIVLLIPTALIKPVYAASPRYARAAVVDAYFCSDKSETTSLFAVPYTYCIEIIRDDGDWYYARYASDSGIYKAVYGYCKKQDFTPESGTPQVTYLYKTVTVNYTADGNASSLPVLGEIAVEAAYYGAYESGGAGYSYVYCQGSFGYIAGKNDDYPLNTPASGTGDRPSDGGDSKSSGLNFGSIAFIVIASLSVVVVLVIYFTTKKPKIDG